MDAVAEWDSVIESALKKEINNIEKKFPEIIKEPTVEESTSDGSLDEH